MISEEGGPVQTPLTIHPSERASVFTSMAFMLIAIYYFLDEKILKI